MTFDEWYKSYNSQLDPLEDDCLEELKSAYEAGYERGRIEGYNNGWGDAIFWDTYDDR